MSNPAVPWADWPVFNLLKRVLLVTRGNATLGDVLLAAGQRAPRVLEVLAANVQMLTYAETGSGDTRIAGVEPYLLTTRALWTLLGPDRIVCDEWPRLFYETGLPWPDPQCDVLMSPCLIPAYQQAWGVGASKAMNVQPESRLVDWVLPKRIRATTQVTRHAFATMLSADKTIRRYSALSEAERFAAATIRWVE